MLKNSKSGVILCTHVCMVWQSIMFKLKEFLNHLLSCCSKLSVTIHFHCENRFNESRWRLRLSVPNIVLDISFCVPRKKNKSIKFETTGWVNNNIIIFCVNYPFNMLLKWKTAIIITLSVNLSGPNINIALQIWLLYIGEASASLYRGTEMIASFIDHLIIHSLRRYADISIFNWQQPTKTSQRCFSVNMMAIVMHIICKHTHNATWNRKRTSEPIM